jgi:hypothetical protein
VEAAGGTPKTHNRTNKEQKLVERKDRKVYDHNLKLESKRKSVGPNGNGNPKKPKHIKPTNDQPDALTKIYCIIKCGGKENMMPTLMDVLTGKGAEVQDARETVTDWVNTKSNQLLQFLNAKTAAELPLDIPSAPTFREMLSQFKCKADKRNNPSELLPVEKYMVLNYLGLYSDCSEYNRRTIEDILLGDEGRFRPMLLRLPTEQLWTWLWSFLNAWVSLAYLIIREEELNEKDVFRFLFLEEALFSVEKYFSSFCMQDFNTLCKDMQTLHDGTVAFASHVLSLESEGMSCENDDLDWRNFFKEAPLDRSKIFVENLHYFVKLQPDVSSKVVKMKKENESAANITENRSQGGSAKPEPILSRKMTFGKKSGDRKEKRGVENLHYFVKLQPDVSSKVVKMKKENESAANITENRSQGGSAKPEPILSRKMTFGKKSGDRKEKRGDGRKDLNTDFDAVYNGTQTAEVKKEKVAANITEVGSAAKPGQSRKTKTKKCGAGKESSGEKDKGIKNQSRTTNTKAGKETSDGEKEKDSKTYSKGMKNQHPHPSRRTSPRRNKYGK